MLGPGERTACLSSDRTDTGGIAILGRDRRTGALRQLRGRFGGLAPTAADRCTPYRRTGGIHFMVRTRDGRFVYSAVENQYAVLALRAVR
jgi:hypothetical protein